MTSVTEIGQAMKTVLSTVGDQVGRQTGFAKRKSKLTGTKFAQTTVLGCLHEPEASLDGLCQTAASIGVKITPQGLDQRFTREAAALLQAVLHAAIGEVIASEPVAIPILRRFNGVIVLDSSIISLPDALAELWQGCGDANGHHIAALKLQVRLDFLTALSTVRTWRTAEPTIVARSWQPSLRRCPSPPCAWLTWVTSVSGSSEPSPTRKPSS